MRHYEIVVLIHPDQSSQVSDMVDRYRSTIESDGGKVHRFEDWGRRQMAYSINNVRKAHYVLMNVECSVNALNQLKDLFKFNDAVLRNLILSMESAPEGDSAMVAQMEREATRRERSEQRAAFESRRREERAGREERPQHTENQETAASAEGNAESTEEKPASESAE